MGNSRAFHHASAVAALALLALSTAASAKDRFEPYEGRDSIVEGHGGTRVTKDGVDFWTHGDPPRRYQVIGIITDKRGGGRLSGDAIGSSSVAKAARAAGGDALILLGRESHATGVVGGGQASTYGGQTYGSGWATTVHRNTTTLVVVKYLPDAP